MGLCCFGGQNEAGDDKSRRCTDKCWLILFVICWIILTIAAIWSFAAGNPARILQGYDSFGNICGQKNKKIPGVSWSGLDMTDCPYTFHMDSRNLSYTMKICVSKCTDRNISTDGEVRMFYQSSGSILTRYDYDLAETNPSRYFPNVKESELGWRRMHDEQRGFGPYPRLPLTKQRPVLNRCVGVERIKLGGNSFINNLYTYAKDLDIAHKIVSDINASRVNITYSILFAIGMSIFVTFTIHYLASIVSTIIMLVSSLSLLALTALSWYVYLDLRFKLNNIPSIEQLDDQIVNEKTFLAFSILLTIITVIILLITYSMRSRIGFMVALFDETASCLRSMPALVFQTVWTCAVLLLFLLFWSTVFLAVSTAEKDVVFNSTTTRFQLKLPARQITSYVGGNVTFSSQANQYYIESVKHETPKFVRYLWWFVVVMLFWTSEFILGCQQMTVASSVATWYFSRDKSALVCPIGNSIRRIARYHMGSIALGSFLIVLFKIPRLILSWCEYYLKRYKDQYTCVNCTLKCCQCFFYCLENFISYINHNAYTIIAIEGTDYCYSAKVAFKTLTSNTMRILTINTMGDFIIFLGKCIVTATASMFGVFLIKGDPSVHYIAAPILFLTVMAYFIAHAMLCVYEMVIDTMFLCFVEDVNKNANSQEGFFAPEGLLKFAAKDAEELKPGALRLASEVNVTRQPKAIEQQQYPNSGTPQIGFVLSPKLVESSH